MVHLLMTFLWLSFSLLKLCVELGKSWTEENDGEGQGWAEADNGHPEPVSKAW